MIRNINIDNCILFRKLHGTSTEEPVDDDLVVGMDTAIETARSKSHVQLTHLTDEELIYGKLTATRDFIPGKHALGAVSCDCDMRIDTYDYAIGYGFYAHSLVPHMLRWHRHEMTTSDISKVENFLKLVTEAKRRRRDKAEEVAAARRRDRDSRQSSSSSSSSSCVSTGQRNKTPPEDTVVVYPWTDEAHPKLGHTVIGCGKCHKKSYVALEDLKASTSSFDTDSGYWLVSYKFDPSCFSCPHCVEQVE